MRSKLSCRACLLVFSLVFTPVMAAGVMGALEAADQSSPVGYWETISDVTGKPRSIVQLYETDGLLYGKIVQDFAQGDGSVKLCDKCSGELHNQPIVGLRFLWDLRNEDGVWKGGRVLDPDNGKIYKCKLSLLEGGEQLNVRGFIGISLLGRSQIWKRLERP